MHKRKLVTALVTAGLLSAGFGASVLPASADTRVLLVTLQSGEQRTVTVDLPAGTGLDGVEIPGIDEPIASVQELPAPEGASTTPEPTPTETTPEPEPTATATTPEPPAPPAPAQPEPAPQPAQPAPQPQPEPAAPQPQAPAPAEETTSREKASEKSAARKRAKERAERKKGKRTEDERTAERQERRPGTSANPRPEVEDPAPTAPASPTSQPATTPNETLAPNAVGVPNFFIDRFRIPPFLLPIYQAAGTQYGVRWEVLAAINEIETDYGRNLNISSAGALGWMQFMPATWASYGVDANLDGKADPYNPVDAIFAAARYLRAAGAEQDLRKAIWAYNHADWYVADVIERAKVIAGIPTDLVSSLTGLTQGHFPVAGRATYEDQVTEKDAKKAEAGENAANPVESDADRTGVDIRARAGSPVVAVADGEIVSVGVSERLGTYVKLRDAYGNTYTYGHLKKVSSVVPVPKQRRQSKASVRRELGLAGKDPEPTRPATAGHQRKAAPKAAEPAPEAADATGKERLFANPRRPGAWQAGGRKQLQELGSELPADGTMARYFTIDYGLERDEVTLKPLQKGRKVIAGTILGRIGTLREDEKPYARFEIRPAGRNAPRIDPKPILDGWKLLADTDVYRAADDGPLAAAGAENPSVGQLLLMSKEQLQRRVLEDRRISIYSCGRKDIEAGIIDRRVLATLLFLASSGLEPTVTSLRCGHSYLTSSGNVSHHSLGSGVDIAAINGTPILGNQGAGSITDTTIRKILTLQGTMQPAQVISLMKYPNAANTLAMPDHADHIHVGFAPEYDPDSEAARQLDSVLKPGQWSRLVERLGSIENPTVPTKPSKYALDADG